MKKVMILFLLATLSFAKNPAPFAAISDDIYSNVELIGYLVRYSEYHADKEKIEKYVNNVKSAKEIGFKVESKDKDVDIKKYLQTLRELSKEYKNFVRKVYSSFFISMKDENSVLFSEMINSGLIDVRAHKGKIMSYYMKHQDEIAKEGVIQDYLDEDAALLEQLKNNRALTKAQRDAAKVKRLRAKDKAENEARNKRLTKEVIKKKKEIRTHQKEELNIR